MLAQVTQADLVGTWGPPSPPKEGALANWYTIRNDGTWTIQRKTTKNGEITLADSMSGRWVIQNDTLWLQYGDTTVITKWNSRTLGTYDVSHTMLSHLGRDHAFPGLTRVM